MKSQGLLGTRHSPSAREFLVEESIVINTKKVWMSKSNNKMMLIAETVVDFLM